ncbi:conjugal transfer protein TraG [Komagataeibacter xylinus]|uniref:Conjugal transfer protein TraG n=1 Tax=Komagataeibacter xylinus TaxID=28448 RepID=A0A318PHG2_KOMXY|nr:TraM recognition domain-containing protein [Komagataeibacter xylinus]PYD56384.1 conjugal transfer protein TraG [Komagataeibacter xylinus]GBQ70435.1 conjugal transfer protein TraG/TraD/DotL/TrbC/IcmO [Komagataeibacter xylinus NBRC 15237]
MVKREIGGPQAHQQLKHGATYRDTRPFTARLGEELRSSTSGFVLLILAGLCVLAPVTVGIIFPLALALTLWVITRRPVLPFHLPKYSGLKDAHDLDPKTRRPRPAAGIMYLGTDGLTGQQLWLSSDAARQHAAVPGTTGAGKTTSAISLLANPLAHGSGFILIDGKGDNTVHGDVLALARRFGLDDQVLNLNFLTASGIRQSNTFNPFATGNGDAIREMLVSQLGEPSSNDANGVFRDRAVGLAGTIAPVLAWMRDTHGVPINIETMRYAMELRWIGTLARHRVFLIRNPGSDRPIEVSVPEIPDDILYPAQAYLGELPGYDSSLAWNEQKENKPSEQHGYAKMYFTRVFTQLGVSLGHIFRAQIPDIDMRDVVLNRRILVVTLPALENSSDTLAGLGKIVVAAGRGVMAQLLGARLDGPAEEVFKLKAGSGDAPFHFFYDELAAYVTDGMDRQLAMGRGLNCMFWLGFQDLPGLTTRIGDKAFTLLGNANLTHAMRLQDAMRTREWIEKQSDRIEVSQAMHFEGNSAGSYREGRGAEVREVARIPWADLQGLIEGEAITMYAGRIVHSKTFFAAVNGRAGAIRMAQPVMLPSTLDLNRVAPDQQTLALLATIEGGLFQSELTTPRHEPDVLALQEAVPRFGTSPEEIRRNFGKIAEVVAGASGQLPCANDDGEGEDNGDTEILTPFSYMLRDAAAVRREGFRAAPRTLPPIDGQLLGRLESIERRLDHQPGVARRQALLILGVRDALIKGERKEEAGVPGLTEKEILARIRTLHESTAA